MTRGSGQHPSWCSGSCRSTDYPQRGFREVEHERDIFAMALRQPRGEAHPRTVGVYLVQIDEVPLTGPTPAGRPGDIVLDGNEGTYSLTAREAARLGAALLRASRQLAADQQANPGEHEATAGGGGR